MEFVSLPFPYFFLVTVTFAWLLRRHRLARNAVLAAASLFFAWKWQPLFLLCLVGSSLWNFAAGEAIARAESERRKSWVTGAAVVGNLGLLAYFKYAGFFLENVDDFLSWLGLSLHLPAAQWIVPLGVSFYTFQGISYVVDCKRGTAVRPAHFVDFLLFMSFFLKFAAGPICRSSELMPQILREPPRDLVDPSRAVALIACGVVKKMILGTYLATHMVEDVFQSPEHATRPELWVVMFAYSAQIYLDFSGYTDIARGCAQLCGFELPENFHYPYAATNLTEYWRRWHMSFSRWLREYLYFPLGGSRYGTWRTALNLLITFTLCGLWHGPRWGFVIWGALHGFGLIAHKLIRDGRRARGEDAEAQHGLAVQVCGWAATLLFCAFARIFFKAETLATANSFAAGLFTASGAGVGLEWSVVALTVLTLVLNFVEAPILDALSRWHARIPTVVRPLAWASLGLVLLGVKPYDVAFTIYFGF